MGNDDWQCFYILCPNCRMNGSFPVLTECMTTIDKASSKDCREYSVEAELQNCKAGYTQGPGQIVKLRYPAPEVIIARYNVRFYPIVKQPLHGLIA
jgi:hypothetical protein